MTLLEIAALIALAVVVGRLRRGRPLALLAASTMVLFWLQPAEPMATLGFWLPFATLGLTVVCWAVTTTPDRDLLKGSWPGAGIITGIAVIVLVDASSHRGLNPSIVAPPATWAAIGIAVVFAAVLLGLKMGRAARAALAMLTSAAIVAVFIVLKTPGLAGTAVVFFRAHLLGGGGSPLQGAIAWLGFSYVAFRLLHTIRDSQARRLPQLSLDEYVNYVIFFPAFSAGPIDRAERFVNDLRAPLALRDDDWLEAGTRLIVGLFKKFVLSELLAVISINDVVVPYIQGAGWMWLFLYAYAFRIYFDFSGYTDVAIGMGRLLGIRLPENFDSPYLKRNIALFWNSWHISLTQWFRSYVFNPLTRALRSGRRPAPAWISILTTQLLTMLLIGLWHGITWNFALWGLWHGLGLFLHNRWLAFLQGRVPAGFEAGWTGWLAGAVGVFLTFNYVALGWLLFGLSTPGLAWTAARVLFGAT